jgi:hypothetical protein
LRLLDVLVAASFFIDNVGAAFGFAVVLLSDVLIAPPFFFDGG